ncbi:hypothetical protein KEJ19_05805 [Candidatus Bathyarchaeota archaeon]|nr:hypothetical protein [Candidatus Bathyarchaeota archaeon]
MIEEALIPPFAIHGMGFSEFHRQILPMDFSIIGTAHSHPSIRDLNSFYGRIMLIMAYPYDSQESLAVFDAKGKLLNYEIVDYDENSCNSNILECSY